MRTDYAVTKMSSDGVAMRPIVNRMTHACENITFPCGRYQEILDRSHEMTQVMYNLDGFRFWRGHHYLLTLNEW